MKKSLLALLLCILALIALSAASCGDTSSEGEEAEVPRYTITLHTITGDSTTDEQIALVEEAFNRITHSKFNTNVVLKLYKESEYEKELGKLIDSMDQKKKEIAELEEYNDKMAREYRAQGKEWTDVTPEPDKYIGPEDPDEIYPRLKENQLDIFLVTSFQQYVELVQKEDILSLSSNISGASSKLSSYVYPTLIRGSKVTNIYGNYTYGVFNNTVFGDGKYQYLLLNKELVDKYEFDPETILKEYEYFREFLLEIKEGEDDVIPLLGDLPIPAEYFGEDGVSIYGTFLGSYAWKSGFEATKSVPRIAENGDIALRNLLGTKTFKEWAQNYNILYQAGCIVEEADENAKFAAKIIEGDVTMSPSYKDTETKGDYVEYKTDENGFRYITGDDGIDYYVRIYQRPIATNADVFGAGYVVSSFVGRNLGTDDDTALKRCMEIITALNTDAELSNILQYGVKDKNYTVIDEEEGLIRKIDENPYSMNIRYTGNIFLKYRSEDMDEYWTFMSKNHWENAKNSNLDSVFSSLLGYIYELDYSKMNIESEFEDADAEYYGNDGMEYYNNDVTFAECLAELKEVSADMLERVLKFKDTEDLDFEKNFIDVQKESEKLISIQTFTKIDVNNNQSGKFYQRYNTWYQAHYEVKIGLG